MVENRIYHMSSKKNLMSSNSSDGEESVEITQERLDQLFEAAKAAMIRKGKQKQVAEQSSIEEEVITIADSRSVSLSLSLALLT